MSSTEDVVKALRAAISAARLSTYETATGRKGDDDSSAIALYAWNAKISGALMAPIHFCEVVIRNAVSDALEELYGPAWPWSPGFEQSLQAPRRGYSPRKDLQNARYKFTSPATGKVIPELNFVFWQKMFTKRHDYRLWEPFLHKVLPNLDPSKPIATLRQDIYDEIEQIRKLRNRIAHHEPIFTRDIEDDLLKVINMVQLRCQTSASWLMENQMVEDLIKSKP